MKCPRCETKTSKSRMGARGGSQRYRCKVGQKLYVPSTKTRAYDAHTRQQALRMIADGLNFRRTARLLRANHQTVINWFHAAVATLPDAPQPRKADVIEMDERYTFIERKKASLPRDAGRAPHQLYCGLVAVP